MNGVTAFIVGLCLLAAVVVVFVTLAIRSGCRGITAAAGRRHTEGEDQP